jgi:crossover junction endodeoxyribonuclease RuvC
VTSLPGETIRVLGIDPGLTRCGVGIVDVTSARKATLVEVVVVRSPAEAPLEQRLLQVGNEIERLLDLHRPQAVAIERVFAQQNLTTVIGVAQISGVALLLAAKRGLVVGLHTPSEVKAAITGYGSADKKQVATMVARVLGLADLPKPADASDALAIAICHAWKRGAAVAPVGGTPTPAQLAWLAAERSASTSSGKRRLTS